MQIIIGFIVCSLCFLIGGIIGTEINNIVNKIKQNENKLY